MAKRKYEFQPDRPRGSMLDKLYLTVRQRAAILKWALYALVLLVVSVVQDVVLCRLSLFGGTTDLVPGAIFMISMILGAESCSIFALISAALFQFSGTGPGYYIIALIPVLAIGSAMFRQVFLRKGVAANFLCAASAIVLYEALLFVIGTVAGQTAFFRWPSFLSTAVLTLLCSFALYPLLNAIDKIGGETWKR